MTKTSRTNKLWEGGGDPDLSGPTTKKKIYMCVFPYEQRTHFFQMGQEIVIRLMSWFRKGRHTKKKCLF